MQKKILALAIACAMVIGLAACGKSVTDNGSANSSAGAATSQPAASDGDVTKVGFVYIGDDSEAYTANFIAAQTAIEKQYGSSVKTIAKYNVAEDAVEDPLVELCEAGCDIIFTTSFGYGEVAKELAAQYPDVQFCQATCANADKETANYHTYMGTIYQGRYVAGIVAGMKMKELIDQGKITEDKAKIGYVAAYPYAEVISGYTAFFLGVRSVVPTATMEVNYTNSWGNYDTEKTMATAMIEDGCVIISQHSDTEGPAEACEDAYKKGGVVFHVGYNQSMIDIAPNTSRVSSRLDYAPYEVAAVQAVMDNNTIDVDSWAGFDKGWVAMTDLNTEIAADGTQEAMDTAINEFKDGTKTATDVFKGDYKATNPSDKADVIDLNEGFAENSTQSAPAFSYVLDDVITVVNAN
mgnify:CR=1 FL=1